MFYKFMKICTHFIQHTSFTRGHQKGFSWTAISDPIVGSPRPMYLIYKGTNHNHTRWKLNICLLTWCKFLEMRSLFLCIHVVNKCSINEQMNKWHTWFYIVLNLHKDSLEQRKGKTQTGNKHQVGTRSARTELEAAPFVGSLLQLRAFEFTCGSGCWTLSTEEPEGDPYP